MDAVMTRSPISSLAALALLVLAGGLNPAAAATVKQCGDMHRSCYSRCDAMGRDARKACAARCEAAFADCSGAASDRGTLARGQPKPGGKTPQ